ncbi:MAG: hypothetical protein KGJ62_03725 [Armatimonadetes bacterium]|nr:hypothetical protein [Armatimonadota bacterium]MDE2205962.1 hypothetical protein [Armatimonadota bacterium]
MTAPASSSAVTVLALQQLPDVGDQTISHVLRLMAQRGCAWDALCRVSPDDLVREWRLKPAAAARLVSGGEALDAAARALWRRLTLAGGRIVTCTDATWPDRIVRCYEESPPAALTLVGREALLAPSAADRFTFGVAVSSAVPGSSTRAAQAGTLQRCDEATSALARLGGVVVTGHNRLPYQRAALAAQRIRTPVVYVIDKGLTNALGPELNHPLFPAARIRDAEFQANIDLALSPFAPSAPFVKDNNRRRDRVLFALCDLVVAGDVKEDGNMLEACLSAHRQRRCVVVLDGGGGGNRRLREAGCLRQPDSDLGWRQIVSTCVSAS